MQFTVFAPQRAGVLVGNTEGFTVHKKPPVFADRLELVSFIFTVQTVHETLKQGGVFGGKNGWLIGDLIVCLIPRRNRA